MSGLVLRAATTPTEHARLSELAHAIWHEHYPGIISVAQIDYMLAHGYSAATLAAEQDAGTRFVLAYLENTPIGLAATTPAGPEAWLDKLYVHACARGEGVARALCQDAMGFARCSNARQLRLRVNRDNQQAIAAYERLGFVIDTQDIKDIGNGYVMDDYLMSTALQLPRAGTG